MDEIELDNFGNWFHLLGSIGFDWDELGGRLRLVRFGSDSLGDNNWLFLLDGFLLFFGRLLDGFGNDDRFGRGNLAFILHNKSIAKFLKKKNQIICKPKANLGPFIETKNYIIQIAVHKERTRRRKCEMEK